MYKSVTAITESDYDDFNAYPQDVATFINQNGGEKKVLIDRMVQRYLNELKIPMLIQKLDEAGDQIDKNHELLDLIKSVSKKSNSIRQEDLQEAVKAIRLRRFRVVAEIKKLSWSSLSLQEPEISLKEESKITGYSEDELREIKGIEKPETEE